MPDIILRSLALPYAISMEKCIRHSKGLNMNAKCVKEGMGKSLS